MDLTLKYNNFKKRVDSETGSILFYRDDIKGLPDHVYQGDGFTVETKNNEVYLIDIFNAEKMLTKLNKKTIDLQYVDLRHSDGYALRMHGVSTLDLTIAPTPLKK